MLVFKYYCLVLNLFFFKVLEEKIKFLYLFYDRKLNEMRVNIFK